LRAPATSQVFISHCSADRNLVDRLEGELRARGIATWVDRRKLEAGQQWPREIERAIDSCHAMLVVLSPDALESQWVRKEYTYALCQHKPIIPLFIRPVDHIPFELSDIQVIDFTFPGPEGPALEGLSFTHIFEIGRHVRSLGWCEARIHADDRAALPAHQWLSTHPN
jgi:hypothetical protein